MPHKWPPPTNHGGTYRDNFKDIDLASRRISFRRLQRTIEERSAVNPDVPYNQLWDGSTWRLTNGSRRQVGLMVSARLDSLVMNDSKTMQAMGAPSECACCGSGFDNIQHCLLECNHPAMTTVRDRLRLSLESLLNFGQLAEIGGFGLHYKKMTLLGRQLSNHLDHKQQVALDKAVKDALQDIDDFRTDQLGMNPMCGRTYTRPPEESLQQAALWDRMWKEDVAGYQDNQEEGDGREAHETDGTDSVP